MNAPATRVHHVPKRREPSEKEINKGKSFANIGLGKETDYLVENLSMLVASGMTVTEALDSIASETRVARMKKLIGQMQAEIESGSSIWRAFAKSGLFKRHTIALVRIGEESGRFAENLKVISTEEQKERVFKSKLRSAMAYPIFVLILTLIIGTGISWFILPKLATVFTQLKLKLPLITKLLIGLGSYLGKNGQIAIPVFILVVVLVMYVVFFFPKTKGIGQTMLFWIPGIKNLMQEVEVARFGYLLGTLLNAGLPVTQSLDSLANSTDFVRYQKFYRHMERSILDGNSFQKSMASYKHVRRLVPGPIRQLVVAGERSGNLAPTLLNIGETLEEKADATTKNLTVVLEPILLVLVWLGVVGVALAVILPIYNLVGNLNNQTDAQQQRQTQAVSENQNTTPAPVQKPTPVAATTTSVAPIAASTTVIILATPTGYLNVRMGPSTNDPVVATVHPGDTYSYDSVQNGWFKILLGAQTTASSTTGWIYGQYVQVNQ